MPAIYDSFARYYDAAFRPLEKLLLADLRRETLSLLPVDADILEIGAGTGANFKYYPDFRHAVAGELSIEMLLFARTKTETIRLVQADAQFLPFDTDRFDAAFATLVFCSIPDPALAFAELIRVVRPGGRVIVLEHVRPSGLLGFVFDALNVLTMWLAHDHFNRRTSEIAARSGLQIIGVRQKLLGIVNLIECRVEK